MLVPDLGDQLLTDLAAWEDEDAGDPFPARQALWLPAPLAGRVALGAVWRLRAVLTPSQCLGVECGRLLRSAGREHARLSVVVLAAGDITILSATARVLGLPGLAAEVADLLDAYAHQDGRSRGREDRAGFIARLAAIAGLLDLGPDRADPAAHRPADRPPAEAEQGPDHGRGGRLHPHPRPHPPDVEPRLLPALAPLLTPSTRRRIGEGAAIACCLTCR